jgi:hypothetical protein
VEGPEGERPQEQGYAANSSAPNSASDVRFYFGFAWVACDQEIASTPDTGQWVQKKGYQSLDSGHGLGGGQIRAPGLVRECARLRRRDVMSVKREVRIHLGL